MRNQPTIKLLTMHIPDILREAGVRYTHYRKGTAGVYVTDANQLVGAYEDLERFRRTDFTLTTILCDAPLMRCLKIVFPGHLPSQPTNALLTSGDAPCDTIRQ
jgi:hypothetical protein